MGNPELLILMIEDITPEYDYKLNELLRVIREKEANPISEGNKKILIFTAFSDTAEYLYENVSRMVSSELGLNMALITGSADGKTAIPRFKADMNHVLACFDSEVTDETVTEIAKQHSFYAVFRDSGMANDSVMTNFE